MGGLIVSWQPDRNFAGLIHLPIIPVRSRAEVLIDMLEAMFLPGSIEFGDLFSIAKEYRFGDRARADDVEGHRDAAIACLCVLPHERIVGA